MTADDDWARTGRAHLWMPYAQMKTMTPPLPVSHIDGTHIHLIDGRVLIDGVASWWTAVHGYRHPRLLDAAKAQLDRLPHIMLGGLVHEEAARLAGRLAALTPGDLSRVFFTESGSVAVEVAMKIAVQYWRNAFGQKRTRFVSFLGGYHGDTFQTMSVCDPEEGMHALFAGALAKQHILPLPDTPEAAAALDRCLGEDDGIAGVLIEPLIQGAGGMRMHQARTLHTLREICDRHGVLLIFDEIFTGFGRTGALFAADTAGVTPDLMILGKALTGGITPLAAAVASERVYAAFHGDDEAKALMHGPTFTGHALACAVANASLDLFEEEPRLAQIAALSAQMEAQLRPLEALPQIEDVRVLGAVAAVQAEAPFDVEAARAWFLARGVFIRPLGRVIYLSPAYVIGEEELSRLTGAVGDFVREVEP